MTEILVKCEHKKVKKINNGDWEWLECTKCGKRINEEDEKDYIK